MIQDIAPLKLNNHYDPEIRAQKEDSVLLFCGQEVLVKADTHEVIFPTVAEMNAEKLTYLFAVDAERYFLAPEGTAIPEGFAFASLRTLREKGVKPDYKAYVLYTGKHLADWYRDARFCGRCGKPMTHSPMERAMTCTCGNTVYPRIMPAIIAGVINGDKLLLTRYKRGSYNALVAGFTEIGETVEETVAREVMEETGVRVKNIRYYKTQPWGSANDLLLGYYCEVDGDDTIHRDDGELSIAQWVSRPEIELQPDDYSLTNEMMKTFRDHPELF